MEVLFVTNEKGIEGEFVKIGRNDPCPCGSGRKYKKCCLNGEWKSLQKSNDNFLKNTGSDFACIEPIARQLSLVLKNYVFADMVKAVFCFNLWRKNRSALAQCLTLNMALVLCDSNGSKRIESYDELRLFYDDIKKFVPITCYEDDIIDDYGEVFINHAGKTYPIIIGTGHQQVYAAVRYMQTLATCKKRESELISLLEYINYILSNTVKTNIANDNHEIVYELPTEDFWNCINDLFEDSIFKEQMTAVFKIMGHTIGPIEMRHFVQKEEKIYPLYNSSILLDYYKFLLNSSTQKDKDEHVIQTLHVLLENSFNFSKNTPNRVMISPIVVSKETGERLVREGILFAGFGKNDLLIALDKKSNWKSIKKIIEQQNSVNGLQLIEPHYREECNGCYGVEVENEYNIKYMVIDSFTDITSHMTWLEEKSDEFECTALDAFYMLAFSENIGEVIEFIHYDKNEEAQISTFGGKSNVYFLWKNSNRFVSSGAIEFDHISVDYNEAEGFTYNYFANQLYDLPRNNQGLFSDPLYWLIEKGSFGYTRIIHKGCPGFGGSIKRFNDSVNIFLAHNVEFFTKEDFECNAHTALKTIDELNERMFKRYEEFIANFDVLHGKTLQLLFVPWQYAMKHPKYTYINDKDRSIVWCDEFIDYDSIIIRYSVNPETIMSAIQNAHDRRIENLYFKELLLPLKKYASKQFAALEGKLVQDASLKKTVGVFQIEQQYYFSDEALDTEISAVSYTKAKKEIAKVCLESQIEPGEYYGKAATAVIRKMQLSVVGVFEKYISDFDMYDLHNKALNYYGIQTNGIVLNLKRYSAFKDLDDEVQLEFEHETRKVREEYRRYAETAKYLIESNLAVVHTESLKKCSKDEFEFLLAFADWLVTLQDDADTCYHTEFDLSISIDSEYRVDIVVDEESKKRYGSIVLRKYNSKDYHVKNDEIDKEYLGKALEMFKVDTGIDFGLFIPLVEYMQLGAVQDEVAKEIYPNIFEVDKAKLIEAFKGILLDSIPEDDVVEKILDFITLNPNMLKDIKGRQQDILPIWEREKRDNRFDVKPILKKDEKYIFSPVLMNHVSTLWKNGILDWYLPYEIGLSNLKGLLKSWKKRYEDEMVKDIAQLFDDESFEVVLPDIDLVHRFPRDNYPEELGDYDVLAVSKDRQEMWIIESKVLQKVGSIYEDQMQQKSFFFQHKDDEKYQRRIDYMMSSSKKVLKSLGIEDGEYKIIPYMVTNKLFVSRYKDIAFPIVTFSEFSDIIKKRSHEKI